MDGKSNYGDTQPRGHRVERHVAALRNAPLFAALSDADLATLSTVTSSRGYRRRELIAGPHEHSDHCWLIVEGGARIYGMSTRGHEITIEQYGPGDVYGLAFLDETARRTGLLEASVDGTSVLRIPLSAVRELCLSHPEFALSVAQLLARRLLDARALIEDLVLHDARARLAHALARLARENEQHRVTATHRELAAMIATRPEEITKLLRRLREEGLVGYRPDDSLAVLDIEGLSTYGS
jgi:CRP/FNR family transcriptional regulator